MEQESNNSRQARKRPQQCIFCDKTFHRSDILHRHYKKCSSRGGAPIPQPLKRGKKKRACDACARSKLSCDSDLPCETCLMNGVSCTYLRIIQGNSLVDQPSKNSSRVQEASTISGLYHWSTVGEINQSILVAVTQIPRTSLTSADQGRTLHASHGDGQNKTPFLLNYVDPNVRSVTDTFGYTAGSPPEDSEDMDVPSADAEEVLNLSLAYHPVLLRNAPFDMHEVQNLLQPATADDQQLLEYFFSGQDVLGSQRYFDPEPAEDQSWFANPLSASWNVNNGLTDGLMYHLEEFCATLPAEHPERSPNYNLTRGLELISPSNITKFVNLYFHHWNRHSPIIHRATFDPGKASLPLLFAVILTGALFSSQNEASKARILLNLAEEYAFRNKPFAKLLAGDTLNGYEEEKTSQDALQAAFSVAQLQLREGSANVRKHTRSTRFGQVITAARAAGLMGARNSLFSHIKEQSGQSEQFEWDKFCHNEARIRFICGLFALDTSFVVFYNMPPRISVEELQIDMPCSLESYFANDTETCKIAITAGFRSRLPRMDDLLALYLGDLSEPYINLNKKSLSALDFYVISLALLRKIWTLPLDKACDPREPARRALSQWKRDWDLYLPEMSPQQSELSGFTKQAAIEFWHLSDIVLTEASKNLSISNLWLSGSQLPSDRDFEQRETSCTQVAHWIGQT